MEKQHEYATKIIGAIQEMLSDEENSNHIPLKELHESDNLTEFIHALATIAPAYIYEKFTSDEVDHLGFNHLANRLCHQFAPKD